MKKLLKLISILTVSLLCGCTSVSEVNKTSSSKSSIQSIQSNGASSSNQSNSRGDSSSSSNNVSSVKESTTTSSENTPSSTSASSSKSENVVASSSEKEITTMYFLIKGTKIEVKLEKNTATEELVNKLSQGSLDLSLSEYGGFEKVGALGFSLPTSDSWIDVECGDVVLYQGNQLSIIYGSNSWSYTKLGKIQNLSNREIKNVLTRNDITVTVSL